MASCRTPGGLLRELAELTGLSSQVTSALADTAYLYERIAGETEHE